MIAWNRNDKYLIAFDKKIGCSCLVRNELNYWRQDNEVVRTIPGNVPYMPRRFPLGIWTVGAPRARADDYRAPWFIPTDAHLLVDEWELDGNGLYKRPTGKQIVDTEYGLHFSKTSRTTLGCIRLDRKEDADFIASEMFKAIKEDRTILFEVFE